MKTTNLPEVTALLTLRSVTFGSRSSKQALRDLHRRFPGRGGEFLAAEDFYVVHCGFIDTAGERCRGKLPELRRYRPTRGHITSDLASFLHDRNTGEPFKDGDWFAIHPNGIYDNRDGCYGIMKPKKVLSGESFRYKNEPGFRKGKGPIPEDIRSQTGFGVYGVIGEYPRVPCLIYCPRCGRPNLIPVPASDDTVRAVLLG